MKNKLTFLALALSAIFLSFSGFGQKIQLKKVADLNIESLATVGIRDYDPAKDEYLGFVDKGSEGIELAIFDSNGKILISEVRRGDGPNYYSSSALTMGFAPDGGIYVQTSAELLKYDREFNVIKRIRFEPKFTTVVYSGPREKFIPLSKADPISFLIGVSNISGMALGLEVPSKVNLIDYYDPNNKSVRSIAPLSEREVFKGYGDEKFPVSINSIYALNPQENLLYLTTTIDNEITVYNPINWFVVKRIKVKHEEFKPLDDLPIQESNFRTSGRMALYAKNQKLLKFDSDLLGLIYVQGESEASYESRKNTDKKSRFRDPDFYRLILFKDGIQLPGEHTISSGMIEMPLPNNRILVKVSEGEVELDYIPYEIWEVSEN
ncbi:hypothetical protein [Algoriphagus machipongonensis]|uniref:Lipoprotein n=1 Tax=Algoriphagus machipongonensis TaxID=388413 RepID=A3HZ05_9BACT|nr:hypothetical protein [Algoriphagus machipongonensis]EAZ80491.1 hypothetical protein ALPR1_06195 [Algoriphagus machipongonensis]